MKKLSIFFVTMVFGFALFAGNVSATPIQGEIAFGGLFTPTGGAGLDTATGLTISSAFVLSSTGDLPSSGSVSFQPLTFAPSTPVTSFWSVSGFSFDLATVSIDVQNTTQLNLSGTGTLRATGFDATPGLWNFTGNTLGSLFSFSSGSASVPDASIMLLLGPALIGLWLVSRKKVNCS